MPDAGGVDTSIYKNQPDPLGTASKVFQLLNTSAQNQLLQTATKQRALELQQSQANDLLTSVAPLINKPGITQAEVKATLADRARQLGIDALPVYNIAAQRYSGPDWQNNLKLDAARAVGVPGITARTPTIDSKGAGTSVPETSVIGKPLPTTLGPGATAAASTAGAKSGEILGNEATNQTDYRRQVFPLEQAIPALEKLGKTGTGPGTDEFNQIKSFLQSAGIPGLDVNKIKNFDEAKKYLTDWVRANGDTSTNDKLAASFSSNASVHISNAAAVDVAKSALAIRRMKYMQLQEFYNTGLPADQFTQWASKWNASHDPRAFGFDHMTVDQRKAILKSLPAAKRAQFMLDVDAADKAGVLSNQ